MSLLTIERGLRVMNARLLGACLAGVLAMLPMTASPALAQDSQMVISSSEMGRTQNVVVGFNKSMIIDLPADVSEVIVSQPLIAGTLMRSQRRAIIQGLSQGATNIFFIDAAGRTISVLEVRVTDSASNLAETIRRLIPNANISVESFEDRVILAGTAQSSDDINKAVAIATAFAGTPESGGEGASNVSSIITVAGAQQVMLKVTVAEVVRETIQQLGINLNASMDVYGISTSLISQPSIGGASSVVATSGIGAGFNVGPLSLEAMVRALERRGAIRMLAEPTLTARSGESAEFLAGGEFPIVVSADEDGVGYEFKEFGVKLSFTPTVQSNGEISLVVSTEVSEPTPEGSLTVGDITVPAIQTRSASTTVQMLNGQTLAIAGLIKENVRQQYNMLPGIGDIPILGALFRSRDFIRSQTELLILVTPYLAEPRYGEGALPTDGLQFAGTAESVFLGHMERLYGVEGGEAAVGFEGSVGFILD